MVNGRRTGFGGAIAIENNNLLGGVRR